MKSTQTENKSQLLNYLVLTGLLLGSISAVSIPSVMGESNESAKSDIDRLCDELDKQYAAILQSFGFVEPQLTDAQETELEAKLASLDAEYDKIFADGAFLTVQDEAKIDALDKKYDAIFASYGFTYPELTESQERDLEAKLAPLEEKYIELAEQHGGHHYDSDLTLKEIATLDSLDEQYDAILKEFGLTYPELTEVQEAELEKQMTSLDAEYDKIFAQFDDDLRESEYAELAKQLESLDARVTSIMSVFGFVEPQLTDTQYEELEKRLAPLDAKYNEIYGDYDDCDKHESNEGH